jgi:cholesterol transport system auxiliary component
MWLTGGCSALLPKATPQPSFYSLDIAESEVTSPLSRSAHRSAAPTLVINPSRAAAGFDSQRIIYLRQAHQLEYFAHHQWLDTPARMLSPLMVSALARAAAFDAVLLSASGVAGDIRLDTEVLRLQQDFRKQPSSVQFTLRVTLLDRTKGLVLATRDLDAIVPATSDNPYAGVIAANTAVAEVMEQLTALCAETSLRWQQSREVH